jgi:hypothetical protein
MGCDIHLYPEVFDGREWRYADNLVKSQYGDYMKGEFDWDFSSRNYSFFAMLADVRNGYGFAGVDTGDGYVPISVPKGVPDNASPEVWAENEKWRGDGHSHSHLTLAELLAYDWEQYSIRRGVVGPGEYIKFKKNGRPSMWSGAVGGANVKNVSNEEMDRLIETFPVDNKRPTHPAAWASYHTTVEWKETYVESVGSNYLFRLFRTMESILQHGKYLSGKVVHRRRNIRAYKIPSKPEFENVRIIFWFDN